MSKHEVLTFDDVCRRYIPKIANYTAHRYRHYGVEASDIRQEIWMWVYDKGAKKIERWLTNSPQQTTRIYRSMLDKALAYAEQEKAERAGYSVDDVMWYTPHAVEGLLPLALDATFSPAEVNEGEKNGRRSNKPASEGGDLLAMVMDVRNALKRSGLTFFFLDYDNAHPCWDANVQTLVNWLGGERPSVGRRRAISNAQAQAITNETEAG